MWKQVLTAESRGIFLEMRRRFVVQCCATGMIIVHGTYHFRPRRLAFRNDYCLTCDQPRRAVQIQTFDVLHLYWLPLLPLGFWKRWACTVCSRPPHWSGRTRRAFRWMGFVFLAILTLIFWGEPVAPDFVIGSWLFRIGGPFGAGYFLRWALRAPNDPALREKLASIQPATDTACPFCGTQLMISSQCTCPICGIVRC